MDSFNDGARPVKTGTIDFAGLRELALKNADRLIPEKFPNGRREGREWVALNPTRDDKSLGSFRINLDTGAWLDHADPKAKGGDCISLWAFADGVNQVEGAVRLAARMGVSPFVKDKGLTLEAYAEAKGFDVEFLRGLGLETVSHPYRKQRPTLALSIPYKRRDGTFLRSRIRQSLHKTPEGKAARDDKAAAKGNKPQFKETRFVWAEGKEIGLYGLERLDALPKGATVLFFEGESDSQTAWLHNLNALGVPGATMFVPARDDQHLKDFNLIVVIDADAAGLALARSLMKSRHRKHIRAVMLQDFGFKDLNALHVEARDRFDEVMQLAMDSAVPLPDFLKAKTPMFQKEQKALMELMEETADELEDGAVAEDDEYLVLKRGTYWTKLSQEGVAVQVPIANFSAKITCEITEDDGVEASKAYEIQAKLNGLELASFQIPAADFSAPGWIEQKLPAEAFIYPSGAAERRLRHAIKVKSTPIPKQAVYLHTGWRKIDGLWVYLHGDGAISANGAISGVSVRLSSDIAAYRLPVPPHGEALVRAVRASLALLELAPAHIMIPSLGAVYRAPLGDIGYSEHLVGQTGTRKSELAARLQQHYGAEWRGRRLPASWKGTANSIEGIAFRTKDAFMVVDDFKYDASKSEIVKQNQKGDKIFRGVGNGAGTSRMNPDGSIRHTKPPRCFIYSTGEDVPAGHSMRARSLILQIKPGDMDLDRLTEAQRHGEQGLFAQALAGYLQWLAPDYEATRAFLKSETERLRPPEGKYRHGRTADAVTDLYVTWGVFLGFASEIGAITETGASELHEDVGKTLEEVGLRQAEEHQGTDPVDRFIQLLRAVFSSFGAHAANENGGAPANAASWGWRKGELSDMGPCGPRIGWIDGDDLYLEPTSTYAAVQNLAEREGGRLEMSKDTLFRRLNERGWLASTEAWGGKARTQVRRRLDGARRCVCHLDARRAMEGDDSGEV